MVDGCLYTFSSGDWADLFIQEIYITNSEEKLGGFSNQGLFAQEILGIRSERRSQIQKERETHIIFMDNISFCY